MLRKFFSIGPTICVLALATVFSPGCALLGLEEEEEETTTVATGSLSDIEGTWSACIADTSDGDSTKYTVTFSQSSRTQTRVQQTYSDLACSSADYWTWTWTMENLTAGSQGTLNNGSVGYSLSSTVQSITLMPSTGVSNLSSYDGLVCAQNGWSGGVAKNIAGQSCVGSINQGDAVTVEGYSLSGNTLYLNTFNQTLTKE